MARDFSQGISLLQSKALYTTIAMIVFTVLGIFGSKPTKDWAVVKDKGGNVVDVDSAAVGALPEGSVLYEGTEASQVKQQVLAEKLYTAGAALCGLLTAVFIKKDPNVTHYLPKAADPNSYVNLLLVSATVGLITLSGCVGAQVRQRVVPVPLADATNHVVRDVTLATHDDEALRTFNSQIAAKNYQAALAVWPIVQADATRQIDTATTSEALKKLQRERLVRLDSLLRKEAGK